ncbi:unnamed protein product, partial [Didymodactylos carnosus]
MTYFDVNNKQIGIEEVCQKPVMLPTFILNGWNLENTCFLF